MELYQNRKQEDKNSRCHREQLCQLEADMAKLKANELENVQIEGLDYSDAWDFCDAFVASADVNGTPLTDDQLEDLNENPDLVYELVLQFLL